MNAFASDSVNDTNHCFEIAVSKEASLNKLLISRRVFVKRCSLIDQSFTVACTSDISLVSTVHSLLRVKISAHRPIFLQTNA